MSRVVVARSTTPPERLVSFFYRYEREVIIGIGERVCCFASSVVTSLSSDAYTLVESGTIGIGQLFVKLGELPHFSLIEVGKDDLSFRRIYTLASKSVVCYIEEVMPITLFDEDFLVKTNDLFERTYVYDSRQSVHSGLVEGQDQSSTL